MSKMTKTDLIRKISENFNLRVADVKSVIEATTSIIGGLAPGEEVVIPGFGKFVASETKARLGRNPATGEPVDIPPKRKLAFRPSKTS